MRSAKERDVQFDQVVHEIGRGWIAQRRGGPNIGCDEGHPYGHHLEIEELKTAKGKNWREGHQHARESGGQCGREMRNDTHMIY